jgi:hypothetical protein
MKTLTLAALVLIGVSFGTTSISAAPFYVGAGAVADNLSSLVQVAKKKSMKKRKYNFGNNFMPGRVLTPYGYADCRGWWEQHSDGRMQCHGVLVRERY